MASFRQKKISQGQTLGDKLNKTRIDQDLSLEEVEANIKVQKKYLEALEEGQYNLLPGDIYAKAWLKLYGQFLGLPFQELIADYKIEKSVSEKLDKVSEPIKDKRRFDFAFLKPRFIKVFFIGLVVLVLVGYLGWEIKNIVSPPPVIIYQPQDNLRTNQNSILVEGHTEPEVQLTINNELVLLDENGDFSQNINLVFGLNNLSINAKKKHSQSTQIELDIFRENTNLN